MKKLSKKLLLPLLVVVIAVGSAFASQIETENDALWVPGYYETNVPCDTEVQCGTSGTPGCLAPGNIEAKGMIGGTCQQPLFRLN